MLLREIKSIYLAELELIYPREEVEGIFHRVIDHYLGLKGFVLAFHPKYTLSKKEEQPLFEALAQLKQEIPIQYVLGQAYFMGLPIQVDPCVLIPRPETEELVAWLLADLDARNNALSILDVGTGSGNIAIAIKKNAPKMQVFGLDSSAGALEVARKNAELNEVAVTWLQQDIEKEMLSTPSFDIVIANPPYVLESEMEEMRNNVKKHEPSQALFVADKDALRYYRALLERCKTILRAQGWVYFEINEQKGPELEALLKDYHYSEIQLKKDIFGKDRMIKAQAPKQ